MFICTKTVHPMKQTTTYYSDPDQIFCYNLFMTHVQDLCTISKTFRFNLIADLINSKTINKCAKTLHF